MLQWLIYFTIIFLQLSARQSATGWCTGYREVCQKAATDPQCFEIFRSIPEYRIAFEINDGYRFAEYLTCSDRLLDKLEAFRRLESFGNPVLDSYPLIGKFSATTLRYICIADQIQKMVALPEQAVIAEIGAGFGGQCFALAQVRPFSKYYFFDLPEVEALIGKVMEVLSLQNTYCIPMDQELPEEKIDLVISNYAFSECDREIQLEYFERVIKKADRGFMIYNHISKDSGIDSISAKEFVQMLKEQGFRPRMHKEIIATAPENVLIIWNRTTRKPENKL